MTSMLCIKNPHLTNYLQGFFLFSWPEQLSSSMLMKLSFLTKLASKKQRMAACF